MPALSIADPKQWATNSYLFLLYNVFSLSILSRAVLSELSIKFNGRCGQRRT